MPSARAWFICTSFFSFVACESSPAEPKAQPAKAEPAKAEPEIEKAEPAKAEPTKTEPTKVEPPAKVEPLSFNLGERSFTAATALSSRFNEQRRIIISALPITCEQLLALPQQYQKGNVSFILTTPWTVGTHPLASAEILDDDTKAITNIYPQNATIEILAAPQSVGESGKIEVSATSPEGSVRGQIDVLLCE